MDDSAKLKLQQEGPTNQVDDSKTVQSRGLSRGLELDQVSEKSVRHGFLRKVFGILTCQLIVTGGFVALFVFCKPVKEFAFRYHWLYLVALAVLIVCILVLVCFDTIRRRFPINIILLSVFTIVQGFALGIISARFQTDTVMIAVGVTAFVVLALTLFAIQTKIDFTYLTGILLVVVLVLILFAIFCAIFPNRYLILVYSCLGALLFSVYLVVDTQLILGGKHRYAISPEEYIFAALNIYLDMINIFIFMVSIVSAVRR